MKHFGFAIADSMFPQSCTIIREPLSIDNVKDLLNDSVVPCLNPSHRATIDAMNQRYGITVAIPQTPPTVKLEIGDSIIVMGVRGLPRLTDRHEYTTDEIAKAEFSFSLYRVTFTE